MSSIRQDLRFAVRVLTRAPGFTVVAALTLGLGIGVNTAMVGLFDVLLTRPPEGVRDPERVVRVGAEVAALPGRPPELSSSLSYAHFTALRTRASGFSGVAAYAATTLSVGEGEAARNEQVVLASGGYFATLGVGAAVGRPLQPDDDREGTPNPVAVLSWDYWQRTYGGDPGVLGQPVRVAGQTLTVVGVAPRHFVGAQLGSPTMWVPLSLASALGYDESMMRSPFVSWLTVIGRLAPGSTPERARSTAQAAFLAAEDERAAAAPPRMRGGSTPGAARVEFRMGPGGPGNAASGGPTGQAPPPPRVRLSAIGGAAEGFGGPGGGGGAPVQLWYLAVTAAVLLIACANVANLLLARGAYRRHELAVRLSIGATPRRIATQLFTEAGVLAVLGAIVGLAVALAAWRLLPGLISMPPLPPLLDPRILPVTAALAAVTVLLFGVAPILTLRGTDIRRLLGGVAPSTSTRSPGRSALVVVQFAVSVVLIVAAGLFIRSFQHVRSMDLGFDRERVLTVSVDTRGAGWTPEMAQQFWELARERVEAMPGVRSAALGATVPYLMRIMMPYSVQGSTIDPADVEPASVDFVAPGFFATLGIEVAEGREFGATDGRGSEPVAIVSRTFARDHFQGESLLGRCLAGPGGQCVRVVGVAEDARLADVTDESPSFVFRPLDQRPPMGQGSSVLHVRSEGEPGELAAAVRRELSALDASAGTVEVRTMSELIAPQLAPWSAAAVLLAVFGGIGLVLAGVGLYGVVAFLVARRTREIGIRIALGATARDIVGGVLGDAGRLVALGAVAGLVLAAAAIRLFSSMLYGARALDPVVYLGTAVLLVVVALAAALAPARRALRVQPVEALRVE